MIKVDETDLDEKVSEKCGLVDHVVWLRAVFMKARARSIGVEFHDVCQLQNELDELLVKMFGEDS